MMVARRTTWFAAYAWLAIGTGVGFFLRIITSLAIVRGSYQSGTFYDLAWIVPFICYAAPRSPRRTRRPSRTVVEAPDRPLHVLVSAVPGLPDPADWVQRALPAAARCRRRFVPRALDEPDDGRRARAADAAARRAGWRTGARRRAHAASCRGNRADGRSDPHHPRQRRVRACQRCVRSRARLLARGAREARRTSTCWSVDSARIGANITPAMRERGIWRGTVVRKRRDGTTFPASCTVVRLRDPTGSITHYVGVERDTTEELKLRDQLVHSERLSAIGELVAGVAHEINNPLQTIVGSVELMMEERNSPSMQRDLELVRREAGRAGQIVRNLLVVRPPKHARSAAVDLNDVIRADGRVAASSTCSRTTSAVVGGVASGTAAGARQP